MAATNKTLPIIWTLLTASHLMHLAMGEFGSIPEQEGDMMIVAALCAAGVSALFASLFVIPKSMKAQRPEQLSSIFIIQWAMIESTGIFGLIARFMGGKPIVQYCMMGLALMGMLFTFPSQKVQNDLLKG